MARKYTVTTATNTTPLQSLAASTTRVAIQLATGSTVDCILIGFDITFDSTATGSSAIPVTVELVREAGVSSGGAAATPGAWDAARIAANTTARINDTTDGSTPVVLADWQVSPTAGFSYQFPLGREIMMKASDWLALRLKSEAGMTTCNYIANLHFEE